MQNELAVSPSPNSPRPQCRVSCWGLQMWKLGHARQHEFTRAAANRAALRPLIIHIMVHLSNKKGVPKSNIYRKMRQQTHANHESSCVCAENGPQPSSHKWLWGRRCAETGLRKCAQIYMYEDAVWCIHSFIISFRAIPQLQNRTQIRTISPSVNLASGADWFDLLPGEICLYLRISRKPSS